MKVAVIITGRVDFVSEENFKLNRKLLEGCDIFIHSDKKYKLNSRKIALACSSHRGENYHIKELTNWIRKIGIRVDNLKCGIHNPLNVKASEKLLVYEKIKRFYSNSFCF